MLLHWELELKLCGIDVEISVVQSNSCSQLLKQPFFSPPLPQYLTLSKIFFQTSAANKFTQCTPY